jgi:hypothetical protein
MPGFDRTGPRGAGGMTGRGQGICGEFRPMAGFGRCRAAGSGNGRGLGKGAGNGRGVGRGQVHAYAPFDEAYRDESDAPATPDADRRALKAERNRLKAELSRAENRLRELGKSGDKE